MDLDSLRRAYYSQPLEVSIETVALCNAACTFCPYPTLERQGTKLAIEIIEKLILEMSYWPQPFFISPFKVNEPLLDERLSQICQRIEEVIPQAKIRLFTNGSPLTARHLEWISKLKRLDHLWVSLNSCDPNEYHDLMHLNYFVTERRLNALHDWVAKGRFPHPVVISRVSDSMTPEPSQRDIDFRMVAATNWPRFKVILIKRDGWLGYVNPNNPAVPAAPCQRWFEMNVTAEGKAVLCCMDGKGEFVLGDVTKQSLHAIYNQPYLKERRLKANTRAGIDPCSRCTY